MQDVQMLALFVVQAVPVAATPPLLQEQILATHDVPLR